MSDKAEIVPNITEIDSGLHELLVTRGLIGLGAAGVWLPGLRLIHEGFPPQERGRATGLFSAGGGIGGTTALVLVPVLAEHFGWRWGYAMPWSGSGPRSPLRAPGSAR